MRITLPQANKKTMIAILIVLACSWLFGAFIYPVFVRPLVVSADEVRLSDMQELIRALDLYAAAHNGMYPESLDVLVLNGYVQRSYVDPVTGSSYRYTLSGQAEVSVCATFDDARYRCVSSARGR